MYLGYSLGRVSRFADDDHVQGLKLHRPDPRAEAYQAERLAAVKRGRNAEAVRQALARVRATADGDENLMPCLIEAVEVRATLGVCATVWDVFGEREEPRVI